MQHVAGKEDVGQRMARGSLRRLSGGDWLVVGGGAVVLLSLLLPWWDNGFGRTANGFHDWGWLSFLSLLMVATLLGVRNLVPELRSMPQLSVGDPVVYMIGGGVEMLGAVVFWLANNSRLVGQVRYGVFVCVVGGAITAVGGYVKSMEHPQAAPPADGNNAE